MRLVPALSLLAAALPLVASTAVGSASSCNQNEFWYVLFLARHFSLILRDISVGTRYRTVACPPAALLRRLPPLRGALAALQGIIGANSNHAVYPLTRLPRTHPRPLVPRVGDGIPLTSIACLPRLLRSPLLLGHPSTTESERPAVVKITSSGTLISFLPIFLLLSLNEQWIGTPRRTAVCPSAALPLLPRPRRVSRVPQGTTGAQHKHAVYPLTLTLPRLPAPLVINGTPRPRIACPPPPLRPRPRLLGPLGIHITRSVSWELWILSARLR